MNDEKLKELIQKDHSTPNAPVSEWNQIKSKITEEQEEKTIPFSRYASAFACLVILLFLKFEVGVFKKENKAVNSEIVAEYMFEDDYLESDDLYAWVD